MASSEDLLKALEILEKRHIWAVKWKTANGKDAMVAAHQCGWCGAWNYATSPIDHDDSCPFAAIAKAKAQEDAK